MLDKRISIFLFAVVYCLGIAIGFFTSGWLFPVENADRMQDNYRDMQKNQQNSINMQIYGDRSDSRSDSTYQNRQNLQEDSLTKYPGRVWGKKLLYQYLLSGIGTVVLLVFLRQPGIVVLFWLAAGLTAGAYARGVSRIYAGCGEFLCRSYIVLAVFPMPVICSLLSGVLWKNRETWLRLSGRVSQQTKRIRRVFDYIRIRFLQAGVLLAVLICCYLLDHEIIKRIQWSLLLRMFRDGVD